MWEVISWTRSAAAPRRVPPRMRDDVSRSRSVSLSARSLTVARTAASSANCARRASSFFIHLLPRAAAAGAASAALRRDLRLRRSQRHRRGGVVVAVRPVRGATGRFSARFLRSGVGVRANFGLEHVDLVRGQTPDLAVVNLNRLRGQRRVLLDVRERLRGGQERVQRDRGVQPRGRERGSHRGVAVRRERRFQPELAGDDNARALDVVSQRHPRVVLVRSLRGGAELREERFPRADAPAVRGGDARVVREQEHVTQKPGRHAREIVPGAQRPERGAR